MEDWYKMWCFKINKTKSVHNIIFTLKLAPCPEVTLYGTQIHIFLTVKYLGMTLNRRLTWAHHIQAKRQQ